MFKVGDKVRAIKDNYGTTTKQKRWEGKVIDVGWDTFDAITTGHETREKIGRVYYNLEVKDFELIEPSGLEGAVKLI